MHVFFHAVLGKIHNAHLQIKFEVRHIYIYILSNQIEEYTFLYGGKDKQWIEQFYHKVKAVAEDKLIEEGNIIIEYSSVGEKSKDDKQLDFDEEIQKKLRSFKNERRWAVFMTIDSEVISDDGKKIMEILTNFEVWKEKVRERSFQICFEEYRDRLVPTGSQPSASRNVV
jgi:hypothetical protein